MRRGRPGLVCCLGLILAGMACDDAASEVDASPPPTDGGTVDGGATETGFAEHLRAAIALNTTRKPLYSALTDGASESLSTLLIASEETLVATAEDFDERAAPFIAEGIPIVQADFVPMADVPPYDRSPSHRGALDAASLEDELDGLIGPFLSVDAGDFEGVLGAACTVLTGLERIEARDDIHLAMTRHLVESAALAALHAPDYAARSGGRTAELSRDLIALQRDLPLSQGLGLMVDARANPFHQAGVGIIVNDLPHIPVAEACQALASPER